MAKLTRFTMPVFAGNAAQTQTSVFGTMKTSPQYTSDVAASIGTTAYGNGWADAIEIGYAPYLEDMNTLQKAITYQISYGQQQGIPEWASDTEYYIGSLAKLNTAGGSQIYSSLVDNNVGNLLSDATKWKLVLDTANTYVTTNTAQTITGNKTFTGTLSVPDATAGDSSNKPANTKFVTTADSNLQTQIDTKAADNSVVKLTGAQTIAGTKTFTSDPDIKNPTPQLYVDDTDQTKGTAPSADVWGAVTFRDANGNLMGRCRQIYAADKSNKIELQVHKANSSSDTDSATMGIKYPASGSAYGFAPNSDVNGSILTTVNKSKSSNGYFQLGNGMVVQWGRVTGITSNTETTVTFPKAFSSSTSYTIVKNYQSNKATEAGDREVSFYSMTATSAKTFTASTDTNSFSWLAIGY